MLKRLWLLLIVTCVCGHFGMASNVAVAGEGDQEIVDLLVGELKSGDRERQTGAIVLARDIPGPAVTRALTEALPELSAPIQVQLISALADRGDSAALPAVMKAIDVQDESVRISALKAIGALGDASSVPLLAEQAGQARGQERKAARDSLYRLRGPEVDAAIVKALVSASSVIKAELIRAVGERNITGGIQTLLTAARDEDRKVRLESFKVLKAVAGPNQLPDLVHLALNVASASDRTEVEKTVAAVAHKIENPAEQAAPVLAVWPEVKDVDNRASLLRILGRIGDNTALPTLRSALTSDKSDIRDAAIRSLADWPTSEPLADLLSVVQNSQDRVHRIVALRGFVRLIGLAEDLSEAQAIQSYRKAMELAPNADEKKRVLSGLASARTLSALTMAGEYLGDSSLQLEAESAAVQIAERIAGDHPGPCKDILAKVVQNTKNDVIRQQAQETIQKLGGSATEVQ